MLVLLINTFQAAESTLGSYSRLLSPMPPITLAYLAAALEQAGVDVAVHDDMLHGGDEAALDEVLRTRRPDVVGLSVVTALMPGTERIARRVRAVLPEAQIVMGNIHADVFHRQLLLSGLADIVVHGEGEETIVDLVDSFGRADRGLDSVPGISFAEDGEVITTERRPYILDLDSLPFPAWHLFPFEKYRIFNFARVREPGTLVLGSRGCPFGCTFCSLKIMGQKRRARSAQNIADEFEYLYDRFGFVQPSFTDPIFPLSKKEGFAFAEELIRRGLHRKQVWITETRVDLVDSELMEALRESGLRRIMYGFETGDPERLKEIRKGALVDKGFEAVRIAHQSGVQVIGFFMLGIPGETRTSMQATIDHAKALGVDFAKFTVFVPFPGTPDYYDLLERGEIADPENWRRYTSYPTADLHPNYLPADLTADDLIEYQRRAYVSFYFRPSMVLHHLLRVRALSPKDMLDGMLSVASPFR